MTRTCLTCGAVLRSENETDYCTVHQPIEQTSCFLEGEELMFMTGGILFGHRALRPGQPVYLQRELHKARVEATTEQIHKAVEMLRRRGLHIVARPRHPGYRLQSWIMPTMTWSEQQADDDLLPSVAEADHKGGQSDGQKTGAAAGPLGRLSSFESVAHYGDMGTPESSVIGCECDDRRTARASSRPDSTWSEYGNGSGQPRPDDHPDRRDGGLGCGLSRRPVRRPADARLAHPSDGGHPAPVARRPLRTTVPTRTPICLWPGCDCDLASDHDSPVCHWHVKPAYNVCHDKHAAQLVLHLLIAAYPASLDLCAVLHCTPDEVKPIVRLLRRWLPEGCTVSGTPRGYVYEIPTGPEIGRRRSRVAT